MKKRLRKTSPSHRASLLLSTSLLLIGAASHLQAAPGYHDYYVAEGNEQTVSESLSDSGGNSLVKSGSGTLILSGSNTYSNSTTVTGGTLTLTGSGAQIVNSGTIMTDFGTSFTVSGGATASAGMINVDGALGVSGANSALTSGTFSVNGGSFNVSSGATFTNATYFTLTDGGTFTVEGPGSAANLNVVYHYGGDILIADGAKLKSGVTYFGIGDNDTARITGEGSAWAAGGLLQIGKQSVGGNETLGSGSIILSEGGHLLVGSTNSLAALILTGTSRSSVYIGGGQGEAATKGGTVQAFVVTGYGHAGGSMNFNHTHGVADDLAAPYVFDIWMTDDLEVNQLAGVTVLDADNDYTAGTNVYGGTLRSGRQGALSAHSVLTISGSNAVYDLNGFDESVTGFKIENGGLLTGASSLTSSSDYEFVDGTVEAALSGTVGAAKTGAGTVTLTRHNTYAGVTAVSEGTLIVENYIAGASEVTGGRLFISGSTGGGISITGGSAYINGYVTGDVVNEDAGFIGGSGTIYGNLYNAATVNPGNSPGTLTVSRNYIQTSSGTLTIEIDGDSHDRLVVSGTAFLDGKLHLLATNRKNSGKPLEIITADGGVNGVFSDIASDGLFSFNVEYLSHSVILEFEENSLFDLAKLRDLTPNQRAVAKSLDRANRRGKLGPLLDRIYGMSLDDVENALTLLSPEQLAQIFQIGFSTAQTHYNNLERRMSDVRDGACGFSTNGLALSNSRGTLNYEGLPLANERNGLTLAGWDGKSVVGKTAVAPVLETSRWSFFATGTGEWADVESTANARGSEFSTGGVTLGADYRVNENFAVGIAGGYTNTGSDLFNGGKIEVNSGRGSLYATVFGNGFYLNTTVGGAYNSYSTRRGTLGGKANGSTEGGEFNSLIGGGYDYRLGGFSIGPVASLQYTYLGLDSFTENGSDAPLRFSSQSQDSLKSSLGLKASYAWNVGGVVIRPEVRAQWQHEYLDSTASVESAFVGGAGAFTVNGPSIGRDSLLLDAGASVQFSPSVSVFAYYTGEIGRTNYSSNAVNGGFRISF